MNAEGNADSACGRRCSGEASCKVSDASVGAGAASPGPDRPAPAPLLAPAPPIVDSRTSVHGRGGCSIRAQTCGGHSGGAGGHDPYGHIGGGGLAHGSHGKGGHDPSGHAAGRCAMGNDVAPGARVTDRDLDSLSVVVHYAFDTGVTV